MYSQPTCYSRICIKHLLYSNILTNTSKVCAISSYKLLLFCCLCTGSFYNILSKSHISLSLSRHCYHYFIIKLNKISKNVIVILTAGRLYPLSNLQIILKRVGCSIYILIIIRTKELIKITNKLVVLTDFCKV